MATAASVQAVQNSPAASVQTAQISPDRIMQMAWGFIPPLVLETAIRHRIFDTLDAGSKDIHEVEQATSASIRGLTAVMNALVGLNLLAKDDSGRFSLTPESATFLVSSKPTFQGGLVKHCSEHLIPRWLHINEVVATGIPVTPVNVEQSGGEFFHDFVLDIFPMSYPAAQALAAHLNYGSVGPTVEVLDLAAGSGVWGIAQAQASPRVKVTAVDWPEVVGVTRETASRFGLANRFSFVAGDLLEADFGSDYDLATLGHILHSEGEVNSRKLLTRTFAALAPGGTVAVQEFLVNKERTGPLNGLFFAANMLVNTQQGNTWSFEEIAAWLEESGFRNPRLLDSPGPSPLILATKS